MQKYLIFGATGSVGSNLAKQLSQANKEIHLIGRNDVELDRLSSELGCDYTVLDIFENLLDLSSPGVLNLLIQCNKQCLLDQCLQNFFSDLGS